MTEKELQNYLRANFPLENERCEWKEFKNLKHLLCGQKEGDVVSYVSAISNMNGGHLVLGAVDASLEIVGIEELYNYTTNSACLKLREKCANLPTEGLKIDEFITDDTNKRVWIIHIPKHLTRQPVFAHNIAFQRLKDSLIEMTPARRKAILSEVEQNYDWSAQIVEDATFDDLDPEAIKKARDGYKEKNHKFAEECDNWSDAVFLDKARLTLSGKITKTTLLLVGKKESAYKLDHIAQIVWECHQDGTRFGDIFTPPFILSTTELLGRIRNYRFKIYPKNSLIPAEVWKYDTESILEGLHNSIGHQRYEDNARIIVTETMDQLLFKNAGNFYYGKAEDYVEGEITPVSYRNPALINAMVETKMIDSKGYGIHKMFLSQRKRYLPMPDYKQSTDFFVVLSLPGTIIDENYSLLLMENHNLSLTDAMLLDMVQKRARIPVDSLHRLRKQKLIEGRMPNIYVCKHIAQATNKKVEYSMHRGLDSNSCEKVLLEHLSIHGSMTKGEIVEFLSKMLSDLLSKKQIGNKVDNILRRLKKDGKITNNSRGKISSWMLVK